MADKAWGYPLKVLDGDTFEMDIDSVSRQNGHEYGDIERVRLAGYSAPELSEAGGVAAKRRLEAAILGRRLCIVVRARDRYGRLVADVSRAT